MNSAGSYATNLKQLRRRVEQDAGATDMPFVFGQVLPFSESLPRFKFRTLIRNQMAAADMASGKPNACSAHGWFRLTDFTNQKSVEPSPSVAKLIKINAVSLARETRLSMLTNSWLL